MVGTYRYSISACVLITTSACFINMKLVHPYHYTTSASKLQTTVSISYANWLIGHFNAKIVHNTVTKVIKCDLQTKHHSLSISGFTRDSMFSTDCYIA